MNFNWLARRKNSGEGRWTGDSRTASAMSVSVICCFRSLLSRCAAIQIVPSGPRLARMYCE